MTDTQTDIRTFRLIERIGTEGRFFENFYKNGFNITLGGEAFLYEVLIQFFLFAPFPSFLSCLWSLIYPPYSYFLATSLEHVATPAPFSCFCSPRSRRRWKGGRKYSEEEVGGRRIRRVLMVGRLEGEWRAGEGRAELDLCPKGTAIGPNGISSPSKFYRKQKSTQDLEQN